MTPSPPIPKFRLHNLTDCSGVKLGASLSRSSTKMKSFPRPSYLANLTAWRELPLLLMMEDEGMDPKRAVVAKAEAERIVQEAHKRSPTKRWRPVAEVTIFLKILLLLVYRITREIKIRQRFDSRLQYYGKNRKPLLVMQTYESCNSEGGSNQ